jgi:glycosyltransferase involved in cell wall biosynthesis
MNNTRLAIVVPCYNEEAVLPETNKQLLEVLNNLISFEKVSSDSYILYVNDGSKDSTWEIIKSLHEQNTQVKGLKLSRNKGHQFALLAGLEFSMNNSDISISIDADLQDDVNAINEMVDKYYAGNDIVYGVRKKRKTDTFFKRFTAQSFYKLMTLLGTKTVYNHADYRLMSKRALKALFEYHEVNVFLRGIVPTIGYNSDAVFYERKERFAGESKYPLKKMIAFAFEGITSFSIKPLTMIFKLGIIITILSLVFFLTMLIMDLFNKKDIQIVVYLVISLWFLGGINLTSVGIVGQYVGKNYIETKSRPRYFVEERLD